MHLLRILNQRDPPFWSFFDGAPMTFWYTVSSLQLQQQHYRPAVSTNVVVRGLDHEIAVVVGVGV